MTTTALPISEQVNRYFFDTISSVNRSNGYVYDLVCERQRVTNKTGHLRCIQIDMEPENILENSPFGVQEVERIIAFEVYLQPSDDDTTPLGEYFANLHSDIVRAVMQDPTCDGLTLDVTPEESGLLSNEDGLVAGVLIQFRTKYRYQTSDPTKQ